MQSPKFTQSDPSSPGPISIIWVGSPRTASQLCPRSSVLTWVDVRHRMVQHASRAAEDQHVARLQTHAACRRLRVEHQARGIRR